MKTPLIVSRRSVLGLTAGLFVPGLIGCRSSGEGPAARPSASPAAMPRTQAPPAPSAAASVAERAPTPAPSCLETHDNIEGPYYRKGAPERWDLLDPGMKGTVVELDGRVSGLDCGAGLRDVELDFWQATHEGRYDNDGSFGRAPTKMLMRGRLRTEADGRYHLRTVVPGHYLNGAQYRPAHVHVKLRAPGFAELTTQLYFPGDPYNDIDPFLHRSLIMGVEPSAAGLKARFDFVLRPA